jgi:DNA-binding Lrp family transcriptional regulator
MHSWRALANARKHIGGYVGKFDRRMHFLSNAGNPTTLRRARAVHRLWYKLSVVSEAHMVPFFVQIKCQLGKSYEVASKLADAEIASEIYSTAGDFDLLVKFYVEPSTDIGHFIAQKVQIIPGIADTRTIITFKAFGAS